MDYTTISLIVISTILGLGILIFGRSKSSLTFISTILCLGILIFLCIGNIPLMLILMILGLGIAIFFAKGNISLILALMILGLGIVIIFDIGMKETPMQESYLWVFFAIFLGLLMYLLWKIRK